MMWSRTWGPVCPHTGMHLIEHCFLKILSFLHWITLVSVKNQLSMSPSLDSNSVSLFCSCQSSFNFRLTLESVNPSPAKSLRPAFSRGPGGPVGLRGAHQGAPPRVGGAHEWPLSPCVHLSLLVPDSVPQHYASGECGERCGLLLLRWDQSHFPAGAGRAGSQCPGPVQQQGRWPGPHGPQQVGSWRWVGWGSIEGSAK